MTLLATENLADVRRWAISAVVVVSVHVGIAAAVGRSPAVQEEQFFPFDFQNVGELAAPTEVLSELPPGPEQVMSEASVSKPTESLEEKPEEKVEVKQVEEVPEVPPAVNPEIPVQEVKEIKQETPMRQEARLPAPATTAPVSVPDRVAPVARSEVPSWKGQISGLLERNKRYPPSAQSRREQGVVQLAFSLDRKGMVVASHIVTSSGSPALDEEAVALLQRAQPFPPPPQELSGDHVALSVPIRFNLK
jgi:periplasmic protein TonB